MIQAAWSDVFIEHKFLNNYLWQWGGLLGVVLGSLILGKTATFVLQRQAKRLELKGKLESMVLVLRSLAGPCTMLLFAGGVYVAGGFMDLTFSFVRDGETVTRELRADWNNVCRTVATLAVTWLIFKLVDVVEFLLRKWTAKTETTLDDQLVPLIRKSLRVFVVIVAVLFIAQNSLNMNIGALVAGLGIGGLAFALAAKDMIANLFGSVTIFADRPFHMGERIRIASHEGVVEEVGFRSTRIRTLTGHLVTIPNSTVANEVIENIGRRPYIKRVLDVTVTYDTAPERIERAVEILREMLEARKEHFPEDCPPRVYFNDFNPASLNIVVYYWFTPPDWWEYIGFNHKFNMELLQRFNDEGIEFAFPTQTLYVKQDSPLTADVNLRETNLKK